MKKSLKTKSDVIEWYWIDFLEYCQNSGKNVFPKDRKLKLGGFAPTKPTIDNFWIWYITDGPMGVKKELRFYSKTDIEYV